MKEEFWNPWHGCTKYSEGCANCYVYRRDESIGKNAADVVRTSSFDAPIAKDRNGEYKMRQGSRIFACMTSDFFLDKADGWRREAWDIIRQRSDIHFTIITKRIVRFADCIPDDWGDGWDNVSIICTVENQRECDIRLPVFKTLPIKHKSIACEPLLSRINMEKYLDKEIQLVICGGESGTDARICDYNWILDIRRQCIEKNVKFFFKQTGAKLLKDGRVYHIERFLQHNQAKKANINT